MRRPATKPRPAKVQFASFPAPTGGLVSNRNLAMSRGPDLPPGAAVLDNFFPTATGVVLRRGSARWATMAAASPVRSLFTYTFGDQREMFAATDAGIWEVSASTGATPLSGTPAHAGTNGDWKVVQFSTAGGGFLIGVNGTDAAFQYDGTNFSATSITFPTGSTLTTADLSFVWVYKERIWFLQKDTLDAWYLPVDQIGGELTLWPMGGVFPLGGTIMWGQSWSLDADGAGGLSEQCVFTTTEGEVAVYQGLSPDPDQGWTKVSSYRIGKPLGPKAFIRAGGDIVVATTVGFISLATAARLDYAALGQNAVSNDIEDDWARAVRERGQADWRCEVWPDGQMALIAPPTPGNQAPVIFASNTNTGKWGVFRGWDARAIEVFAGRLFFGTTAGTVREAWTGGTDEGVPYTGQVLPLFDNLGAPGSLKVAKMARAVVRTSFRAAVQVSGQSNFKVAFPPAPVTLPISGGNVWGLGVWGEATWGGDSASVVQSDWVSVGASGHDIAIGVQIPSGAPVPLNAELVRIDLTYTVAEIGT